MGDLCRTLRLRQYVPIGATDNRAEYFLASSCYKHDERLVYDIQLERALRGGHA
jgi:hypothetical protein